MFQRYLAARILIVIITAKPTRIDKFLEQKRHITEATKAPAMAATAAVEVVKVHPPEQKV